MDNPYRSASFEEDKRSELKKNNQRFWILFGNDLKEAYAIIKS